MKIIKIIVVNKIIQFDFRQTFIAWNKLNGIVNNVKLLKKSIPYISVQKNVIRMLENDAKEHFRT